MGNQDLSQAAEIYWKEMLARVHIVCLVSSFKTLRWIEALDSACDNYYGFCTSLRGLIESCADTFYTLRSTPLTLAKDFLIIKKQIERTSNLYTTHAELESSLLHYLQATKLKPREKEKYPDSFNAKSVKKYLTSMDNDRLVNLYEILCGISHPSYESTQIFLFLHEGKTIVCNDSFELEKKLIKNLIEIYAPSLSFMIRVYMNNLLSVLLILNEFEDDNLLIYIEDEGDFKETEVWKEVQRYIDQSNLQYKNGDYNI
ncbi:MAG: hypothetical protein DCE87_04735 [Betaproteobacteria bacterium]|nr:MAG: hypothetical protein DCE87_04735 [Betaproteobacteria bacterium]PZO25785.1 MAG: hypothetical protein DCE89_02225 [Betaproteobacteria bacterium]